MSTPEPLPVTPVPISLGAYRLDAPTEADLADVAAAFDDPEIGLWNPGARRPGVSTIDRARLWVADRAMWSLEHASWVIRDSDGTLVGQVSVHHIDLDNGSGEIGYWLTPRGRGRGLGTAAVEAATRYSFDTLGLLRIELFHAVGNEASCRLAVRCGYPLEGTARQSYVYGDGLRHDEHLHARLSTDPDPGVVLPR